MTLIVSVRSNEGIVLAGDTLASSSQIQAAVSGDMDIACPTCDETFTVPSSAMGTVSMPMNRFPSARKVFPLFDTFGIGVFGASLISGKTAFFIIRQFGQRFQGAAPPSLTETRDLLIEELSPRIASDPLAQGEGWSFGFQLVGYLEEDPFVLATRFHAPNTDPETHSASGPGGYIAQGSGREFVDRLMQGVARHSVVSLGDAVGLAKFAVQTTIDHQRFGSDVPTVGGQVDILQVTPYYGCRWIEPKGGRSL